MKSEDEFLFTAPVMIPGRPDCDYHRGETPFTAEEIRFFKESFDNYQLIDKNHAVFQDLGSAKTIGEPKESFILENDTSLEFTDGTTSTYPAGTWMLTTNVTDTVAQNEITEGKLTGYSPSVNNHDIAELIKQYMATKASAGKLIHEIKDPETITVSIVKKPCQTGSKACKNIVRSDNMSEEKKTLEKIRELLNPDKKIDYATKSDFDALADELKTSQEAAIKSMGETIGTVIADSLKELGAVKSRKDEEEDEGEDQEPEEINGEGEDQESEEEDESDSDEDEKKKKKDGSKQGNIHNGATKGDVDEELDTYAFLGRHPDGTSKRI